MKITKWGTAKLKRGQSTQSGKKYASQKATIICNTASFYRHAVGAGVVMLAAILGTPIRFA
jgi:hypothetical protein